MPRLGDAVELHPEPKNPADPSSIAVFSAEDAPLGHLPAGAPYVGTKTGRAEVAAIFQGSGQRVAFVRIPFDQEPVAPPVKEERLAEPDW